MNKPFIYNTLPTRTFDPCGHEAHLVVRPTGPGGVAEGYPFTHVPQLADGTERSFLRPQLAQSHAVAHHHIVF